MYIHLYKNDSPCTYVPTVTKNECMKVGKLVIASM
jgi:hypothetical protein